MNGVKINLLKHARMLSDQSDAKLQGKYKIQRYQVAKRYNQSNNEVCYTHSQTSLLPIAENTNLIAPSTEKLPWKFKGLGSRNERKQAERATGGKPKEVNGFLSSKDGFSTSQQLGLVLADPPTRRQERTGSPAEEGDLLMICQRGLSRA